MHIKKFKVFYKYKQQKLNEYSFEIINSSVSDFLNNVL